MKSHEELFQMLSDYVELYEEEYFILELGA